MQQFLSAFILSISSNLDTFAVSISYGMHKIKLPISSNLLIALITTLGTFLSMLFGKLLTNIIPNSISNFIGGIALVLIGIWFLIESIRNKESNNFLKADSNGSRVIELKETIPLAFALTVNNLGVGISASITGISIFYSTIFTFIITSISIFAGSWLGHSFLGKLLGKYAPAASSILLIILGIYESFI
ncbi:manganese efflux pump MntP family protein [Clostridium sardiniense]|uniref:manganese efflux pump MntP n=1 Tax=Clostridium sardiniense TaxID=29369 RepID=UPI003D34DCC9